MNPTQPSGWLNIDDMLQSLEQQPSVQVSPVEQQLQSPLVSTPAVDPVANTVTMPTFSVETLQKPTVIESVSPLLPKKRTFMMPGWLKVTASMVSTLLILVIWAWVLSVQYPEESSTLLNGITGTFSNLAGVTQDNMEPDGIIIVEDEKDEVHGVADQDPYTLPSPLADAMDTATNTSPDDNKAEELFGNIYSGSDITNAIDFSTTTATTTGIIASGSQTNTGTPVSTHTVDFDLPSMTDLPTHVEFQQQVLELSEQSQTAMTNLIGSNDVSLAKMRVVYKNTQTMLEELTTNQRITQDHIDQLDELKTLYNSVAR